MMKSHDVVRLMGFLLVLCLLAPRGTYAQRSWDSLIDAGAKAEKRIDGGENARKAYRLALEEALRHPEKRLQLAESLEHWGRMTAQEGDEKGGLKLIKEARQIKIAELGPTHPAVADNLLVAANWRYYSSKKKAVRLLREARDIRRLEFGYGSCEAAYVDLLILISEYDLATDLAAEDGLREIMAICPPLESESIDGAGLSALIMLRSLLEKNGRFEEAEELGNLVEAKLEYLMKNETG